MAYSTDDGFKSTNRAPMMAHKRSMERKSAAGGAGVAERVDPLAQPAQPEHEMGGESPEAVAQEHGPAHEVHMTHDHEGGQHHVHSMHPDGHEHHSDHGSAEEAHDHAKGLASHHETQPENDHDADDAPEYE